MSLVQYPALHLQSSAVSLPSKDDENALHCVQFEILVAFKAPEKVMFGQFTHGPVFVPFLYLPTPHCEHGPPADPLNPATHKQLVAAVLPAGDKLFSAQSVHTPGPLTAFHFPAEQAEHGPPFGPVYPATHEQLDIAVLAAGEVLFAGHCKAAPVPGESLYHPAGLGKQEPGSPV